MEMIEIETAHNPKDISRVLVIRADLKQVMAFVDTVDGFRKQYLNAIKPNEDAKVSETLKFLSEVAKMKEYADYVKMIKEGSQP